jgi:hypothetical protein
MYKVNANGRGASGVGTLLHTSPGRAAEAVGNDDGKPAKLRQASRAHGNGRMARDVGGRL